MIEKLHFAHLDAPWKVLGYDSIKNIYNSDCFALTNIGIQIPASLNIMFSRRNEKNGILGKSFRDYLYGKDAEFLFQRQLESKNSSGRSGSFRGGSNSKGIKLLISSIELLKKNMLDRIITDKLYTSDEDLYPLGEGIFIDSLEINPILASCFSEIRECKFKVPYNQCRSQERDRFKRIHLEKLINGEIILEQISSNSRIIPEYGFYSNNVDKKKLNHYHFINKEKIMTFEENNRVRSNGRTKNIIHILGNVSRKKFYCLDFIIIQLNEVYGENIDIKDEKQRRNVQKTLAVMVRKKIIFKNKKGEYYMKNILSEKNVDEVSESVKNALNKMHESHKNQLGELYKNQLKEIEKMYNQLIS